MGWPVGVVGMTRVQKKFSIFWFSFQALGQYALLLLAFRLLLPGVWTKQFAGGWLPLLLTFLAAHLFLCFFEWGFHRYVLHSVTNRYLLWFARGHRSHHGLTPIRLQPVVEGSDRYVLNRYPIIEEEQFVDSAFPPYAIVAFWALFTPLLIGVQLLLPGAPVLMGGYAAITWSMCLYEILHAIEHRPYVWWKQATEHLWLPSHASRQHLVQRGHLGLLLPSHRRLGLPHLPPAEGAPARRAGGDRQGLRDPASAGFRAMAGWLGQEARITDASGEELGGPRAARSDPAPGGAVGLHLELTVLSPRFGR
jgi:hypothetical protein